ncbi:AEC family transporter [Comamonas aquatica]|uniref:AEC family transporter n=1 Tax=Comamonas aquatica TaxID=225991 RepID=UPI0005EC0A75|nr:AEC family transporter [Comamonas aquatica]ANY63726.1 transporter [Comamonas aquatica]MDH0372130.1 AEC family transporter [Comamonas aquatica]MDH0382120.1 AEC family transporter [Comamonas aquatica]MDH0430415.1 AEC family transporter [Comamonas aquatica]MDH0900109.1 AEC family transporter [Comamonas aquatica]
MDTPALTALLPVVLLIVLGFITAKLDWVRPAAVKDLTNLVFYILTPALLFRTMASVKLGELDFSPILVYFLAVGLVFVGTMLVFGFNTLAAARALAHTFSNNVMIGIPLVGLVYGQEGLVTLLTLISVHALVLLGSGTVVFELAQARQFSSEGRPQGLARTLGQAIKNSVIHPIPLPIIAGLLYAQTGWGIPGVVDKPLQLLGSALGPMALLLVGITLAYSKLGSMIRPAMRIAVVKTVVHPILFLGVAWLLGLRGIPMAAMALAAGLPVGANVYIFSQRYGVAQEEVTACIALSTGLSLFTLPVVLLVLERLR